MKSLVLLAWVLMLCPARSFGQPVSPDRMLGVYAHPSASDNGCGLLDTPGLVTLFVVYTGLDATSVTFSAPNPTCSAMMYIADTVVFAGTSGNSQTEVTVDFGSCLVSPGHVLTVNLF